MNTLVVIQTEAGKVKKSSIEAVSAGRTLADETKGNLIVLSFDAINNAEALGVLGAEKLLIAQTDYNIEQYANIIANAVSNENVHTILFSSTILGKDLAARAGAKVGGGVVFDCFELKIHEGMLQAKKRIKNYVATMQFNSMIRIATISPNTQQIKIFKRRKCVVEAADVGSQSLKTIVKERVKKQQNRLENAEIVVCGGYGVKDPANFKMIELLAQLIKGEVGATRTAVEAGLAEKEQLIGDGGAGRGTKINPLLYIGCGVNGSEEHMKGIQNSRIIIAINKNHEAPIFQHADYCIVDDMWRIVPDMITEIEKLNREKRVIRNV